MADAVARLNAAVGLIVPEVILLATVCVMFITGPFLVNEAGAAKPGLRKRWTVLALVAIAAAALAWYASPTTQVTTGPFRIDGMTSVARGLSLALGTALVLLLANQIDDGHSAEANACLLAILAGANLTAIANDLVALFLALELVSIPTYVLLYLPRRDKAMQEATIKYVLLSIFSSAVVLYGMSLLYGAAGSTNLSAIRDAVASGDNAAQADLLRLSTALLIAGLSFRIAAVPFHFYAPDVFQGVTSSAAAMLSFIPKLVGFVALARLLPLAGGFAATGVSLPENPTRIVLAGLAVVTMLVGNVLALRQQHLHRLLAYSSIAHAGYMLVGLAACASGTPVDGLGALFFYLAVYGVMTIGVFALLAGGGTSESPLVTQNDLAGLSRTHPAVALMMAICLFSLTGLPPTAGFTGKLNLFFASWSEGTSLGHVLAGMLALNAAISAWYYLRLIAVMFLEPPRDFEVKPAVMAPAIAGAICTFATIAVFIAPQALWRVASALSP